ncbi:LysM domain-containing protein [Brenneria sp. g21c3]|uniref:LysM peptidoglycan-binding domain-containing protein n=1 Tax=Brenneria sp. g21c3 TaxID=3093893 RepID=UPI002EA5ED2B|nr:LysM domain-containing protein [Brenneria sp. g21c3]
MSDLYSRLYASKGKEYYKDAIISSSRLKIYPDVNLNKKIKGNSRISGDIDKQSQQKIIDMLITIGVRYGLNYREIAYVLLCTHIESGFNPDAAAGSTTAAGLAQATIDFVDYTYRNSSKWLGFVLDIKGERIFDAELGCYTVIFSFLRARDLVADHYSSSDDEYWKWLYYLHHDGMSSLRKFHSEQRNVSPDAVKWGNYIVSHLSDITSLLKNKKVNTKFKLSSGSGIPVAGKNYIAMITNGASPLFPDIVSHLESRPIFFRGVTDSNGMTMEICTRPGSEIVFSILRGNYKYFTMSGNAKRSDKEDISKQKQIHELGNSASFEIYIVKPGDTLLKLAKRYDKKVEEIAEDNNLKDPNIIHVGQKIKIVHDRDYQDNPKSAITYTSRYINEEIKQQIVKYLGVENGNTQGAIAYSRSHIALPAGSVSADVENKENIVHLKTTTDISIEQNKTVEQHQTDTEGTAKEYTASNGFEPVIIFLKGKMDENRVSDKTKNIIKDIAKKAGIQKIHVTSTLRTPREQARAMYENIRSKGVASQRYYKEYGRMVIQAGVDAGINNREFAIKKMEEKIIELINDDKLVSRHCVSEEMYSKRNVLDISKTRLGRYGNIFDREIQNYIDGIDGVKYISPYANRGEPAFHLEIVQ